MLASRCGEEARRLEVGGRCDSYWWRGVVRIRDDVGEERDVWLVFREGVAKGEGWGS